MPSNNNDLWRYAGLGAQLFVSLGIAVYLGHLADNKLLQLQVPIATIVFPLVILIVMIYNIVKQTSKKKQDEIKKPLP